MRWVLWWGGGGGGGWWWWRWWHHCHGKHKAKMLLAGMSPRSLSCMDAHTHTVWSRGTSGGQIVPPWLRAASHVPCSCLPDPKAKYLVSKLLTSSYVHSFKSPAGTLSFTWIKDNILFSVNLGMKLISVLLPITYCSLLVKSSLGVWTRLSTAHLLLPLPSGQGCAQLRSGYPPPRAVAKRILLRWVT